MLHCGYAMTPPLVSRVVAFPKRLKESKPRQGFIGEQEYATLAKNAKPVWLRALIAVAYNFGFRKGELLGLRKRNVDLLGGWLTIEDSKNGDARKVCMTPEVEKLMRACISGKTSEDAPVFTRANGEPVADARAEWYALCVASKLGKYVTVKSKDGSEFQSYHGLNLHDFRRSAIRNMTRRNVPQVVAMKISGHRTASVFRRYDIVDDTDLIRASEQIEQGRGGENVQVFVQPPVLARA